MPTRWNQTFCPPGSRGLVNIMLNKAIPRIAATMLFCVTGCQDAAHLPKTQILGGGTEYKTSEEVRALFPEAKWLEFKQGDTDFMFCANVLPAYGNSRMEVQGWVFRHHSKVWENVLTVYLNGVVDVKLSVDPKTGLFSAKGSADNKFKDESVCTFDLRAGE
jgi:hypothetical protein